MNHPAEQSLNKNDNKSKKQANKKDQKNIDVPCKPSPPFTMKIQRKRVDVPPKPVPLLSSSLAAETHVAVVPHIFGAASIVATSPSTKTAMDVILLLSSLTSHGKENGNKPGATTVPAARALPLVQSSAPVKYIGLAVSCAAVSLSIIGGPRSKHAL